MKSNELSQTYLHVLEKLEEDYAATFAMPVTQLKHEAKDSRIEKIILNADVDDKVRALIKREFLHFGPLSDLVKDPDLTEIIVNSEGQVFVEKNGKLSEHTSHFICSLSYHNFIDDMTRELNSSINLENPYVNGVWRGFRVHLIGPPVANGYHISLRKKSERTLSMEHLYEFKWAPQSTIDLLKEIVLSKKSFLIVGGTGSGKTSVLNACLQLMPATERVVAIEDTAEITLPNSLSCQLLTRVTCTNEIKPVDQAELLRQSLRMRPDRIVVGEVRSTEAKDLIMALSTGHEGSISTMHADSAAQALTRLEMLVQLGAPQWSTQSIRNMIRLGLHYIVTLKKINGCRKLSGIHQIASLEDSGFCLDPIYEHESS